MPAKRAASDGSERGINREYFASSRPAFMSAGGLTPAQRGTATHKFMQFSNYAAARDNISTELDRLVESGFLSKDEGKAVNVGAVRRFFASPLAGRIFASDSVMREKKFAALFSADFFYPELKDGAAEEKLSSRASPTAFLSRTESWSLSITRPTRESTPRSCSNGIPLSLRYTARRSHRRSKCPSRRRFCTLLYEFGG